MQHCPELTPLLDLYTEEGGGLVSRPTWMNEKVFCQLPMTSHRNLSELLHSLPGDKEPSCPLPLPVKYLLY